jgi:hypothetical protein
MGDGCFLGCGCCGGFRSSLAELCGIYVFIRRVEVLVVEGNSCFYR